MRLHPDAVDLFDIDPSPARVEMRAKMLAEMRGEPD
jgi:hypothetical protein